MFVFNEYFFALLVRFCCFSLSTSLLVMMMMMMMIFYYNDILLNLILNLYYFCFPLYSFMVYKSIFFGNTFFNFIFLLNLLFVS